MDNLQTYKRELREFTDEIYRGENKVLVYGQGPLNPELMLIGEAPGEQEALAGRPFIGKAGKNLDEMLERCGLTRAQIYIANAVKFRPVKQSKAGRVVNRPLYEGQVQGGVVMGMGYALTESIPVKDGYLTSGKLNACGLLRSVDVPEIEVIAVEVPDPEGPCGAKGIGEIACIPTAPAIVNALYLVDGVRRRELPVRKKR